MSLRWTPLSDLNPELWSAFVDKSEQGWVSHHQALPASRPRSTRAYAVVEDGQVRAGCILSRQPRGRGAILSGPGVVLANEADGSRLFPFLREAIVDTARRDSCQAVWMHLPAIAPGFSAKSYFESPLFPLGFSSELPWGDTLFSHPGFHNVVDLTSGANTILRSFSENHRRAVKRAERSDLAFSLHTGPLDPPPWSSFHSVHVSTFNRTGVPPYSDEHLATLRHRVERGLCSLAVLHHGDECIAAAVLETYKKRVSYLAGGATDRGLRSGAFVLLHYRAMIELGARGYLYYDMGPTFPALAGTKMGNIGEFKRRFGGDKWPVLAGELVIDAEAYARRILWPCLRPVLVRSAVPRRLRTVLRGLREAIRRDSSDDG